MSSRPPLPIPNRTHYAGAYGVTVDIWKANRFGQRTGLVSRRDVTAGSITHSDAAEIPRILSVAVDDPSSVREFVDYLIPEITLTRADGTFETGTFGLFMATPPKTNFGVSHRLTGTIEGKDLTYILMRSAMPAVTYPAGRDVGSICHEIALGAGFQESQLDLPNTGYLLASDFKVSPGESRLETMNELYAKANWYPVWMSNACTLKSRREEMLQDVPARKIYTNTTPVVEILPNITGDTDWSGLKNKVTLRKISGSEDEPDIWSTKRITNTNHPLYYNRENPLDGNFPIELSGEPIDMSDIETQSAMDAAALIELNKVSSRNVKISMSTIIDIFADAHDVLELGVYSGNEPIHIGKWWRDGWTIQLDGVVATIDSTLYRVEDVV